MITMDRDTAELLIADHTTRNGWFDVKHYQYVDGRRLEMLEMDGAYIAGWEEKPMTVYASSPDDALVELLLTQGLPRASYTRLDLGQILQASPITRKLIGLAYVALKRCDEPLAGPTVQVAADGLESEGLTQAAALCRSGNLLSRAFDQYDHLLRHWAKRPTC